MAEALSNLAMILGDASCEEVKTAFEAVKRKNRNARIIYESLPTEVRMQSEAGMSQIKLKMRVIKVQTAAVQSFWKLKVQDSVMAFGEDLSSTMEEMLAIVRPCLRSMARVNKMLDSAMRYFSIRLYGPQAHVPDLWGETYVKNLKRARQRKTPRDSTSRMGYSLAKQRRDYEANRSAKFSLKTVISKIAGNLSPTR